MNYGQYKMIANKRIILFSSKIQLANLGTEKL